MKRNLTFRRAAISDASTIAHIGAETFKAAFGPDNTPEDMEEYLASNFNQATIQSQIADKSSSFLMGCDGGKMIGYAFLKEGVPPGLVKGESPIELVRIYVIEKVIGSGYGSQLMRACLDEAKKMGHATLWLGVWEENERAIRFYKKWGFRKVGEKQFILGRDEQTDLIMERSV
jgi:ribosomal protein S18 acetylase RimI-like enzyme